MQNFWQKLNRPFTVLAPMANVTDWAFRQIITETGRPDVFFTEFISADGINAMGYEKFKGELYFEENERPIVVQFFSANPENMYKAAKLAVRLGFDGIDINMGCPDKSIEKQGAGAALIKNPHLAVRIINETIRGAHSTSSGQAGLPVSVKTRLGFNRIEQGWLDVLLDTDITALSVHLRTRKEMSKVSAHWEEAENISKKAKKLGKLVIGNGDVLNLEDGLKKAKQFGLDGIMVGRGIFQNPWFFNESKLYPYSREERIKLLVKHMDNFEKLWSEGKNFDVLKRFFKIYINGFPGAKELRAELMNTHNKKEVVDLLLRK